MTIITIICLNDFANKLGHIGFFAIYPWNSKAQQEAKLVNEVCWFINIE